MLEQSAFCENVYKPKTDIDIEEPRMPVNEARSRESNLPIDAPLPRAFAFFLLYSAPSLLTMLPSPPSSSPPRPVLINRTNANAQEERETCSQTPLTPPPDRKRAPPANVRSLGSRKRVKLDDREAGRSDDSEGSTSDADDVIAPARRANWSANVFGMRGAAMRAGPSSLARLPYCA